MKPQNKFEIITLKRNKIRTKIQKKSQHKRKRTRKLNQKYKTERIRP